MNARPLISATLLLGTAITAAVAGAVAASPDAGGTAVTPATADLAPGTAPTTAATNPDAGTVDEAAATGSATASRETPSASALPEPPIPDTELGLSKSSVFSVPTPPAVSDPAAEPGEGAPLERAFPGAPPLIPHAIADMLPLTRTDNLCLLCHLAEEVEVEEGDPLPVPPSHRTDLRRTPGEVGEELAGARYVCTACHIPQTAAEPLVGNRFR